MVHHLLVRLNRRYVVILTFVLVALLLWQSFHIGRLPRHRVVGSIKYIPSSYDWSKAKVYYPITSIQAPPSGRPKRLPPVQTEGKKQDDVSEARKQSIKTKFVKSWEAYKTYAWTRDELMPLSSRGKQSLSGWSAQLVDALDTLWIMDLKDDFRMAVKEVAVIDWAKTTDKTINVFEVTIRYLGGLLSAYELSAEPAVLAKAIELGDTLYAAFDTPNRLPSHWLDYKKAKSGQQQADIRMSPAAGGSLCLEMTRLSQLTGDNKYYDGTERLKQFFYKVQNETQIPGLWPEDINYREMAVYGSLFSLGAGEDSMYEYLPKMHALLGGLDPQYEEMTVIALDAAIEHLLFRPLTPNDEDVLFSGIASTRTAGRIDLTAEVQHLACFVGGMYALAGRLLSREDYVDLGSRFTWGCVWAYQAFESGIMPEISQAVPCANLTGPCLFTSESAPAGRDRTIPAGFIRVRDSRYLLRPEAIESVFYMWRITGDQKWRDAAWTMWEAVVKETETEMAFASIDDVKIHLSEKSDSMETFWMGETLKYFYLIFEDPSVISLDEWVFNTEAHPFKRPS